MLGYVFSQMTVGDNIIYNMSIYCPVVVLPL